VPPKVATDLHRDRKDPDDNKDKNPNALSIEEFIDYILKGWKEDKGVVGAGSGVKLVERWYNEFDPDYKDAGG
jgi:hypothetical protein